MVTEGKAHKRSAPGWTGFFERGLFAPFLLSIQPVLQLFVINLGELDFSEILRPLLLSLLFAGLVFGLTNLFLRHPQKASLVASLFIFFFFLFGDLSRWVAKTFGLGPVRANLIVLAVTAAAMLAWIWLVQRRIKNIGTANLYFNLLAILFLVSPLFQMGRYGLETVSSANAAPSPQATAGESQGPRPDIYYIILDGYGRQDILQQLYDYDNSSFVDALAAKGFYVARESSSNYIQTLLSLGSSLNLDYLQSLQEEGTAIENRSDLIHLLENSKVRQALAQEGYRLVSFRNGYKATIPDADIYYDDTQSTAAYPVTAFESILIDHSMLRVLSYFPAFNRALVESPYDTHRRQILSTFTKLQEIPSLDGDYFVYAHIIAPHPPFVFDEKGQAVSHEEPFTLFDANYYIKDHSRKNYIAGYRRQIQYVNQLVLETVNGILARSETPPIIIIQGDHGPGAYLQWGSLENTLPAERLGILNAYYFPGQDYSRLYPSISPVNSFRVVLDQFFGDNYPLLPDRHYYSPWMQPLDFVEIKNLSLP